MLTGHFLNHTSISLVKKSDYKENIYFTSLVLEILIPI